MRTRARLKALQQWTWETVCKGRKMKTPAPGMDVTKIVRQEPRVFLAYPPTRPDETKEENLLQQADGLDPLNVAPGIILAPVSGEVHFQEEKRFDRYNNVSRPKDMGQSLLTQLIFIVFEDGVRLPGFIDAAEEGEYPMNLIREGTEDGLFTLTDWMDDFRDALLSAKTIPGTDMVINDEMFEYGWYSDQKFIADRRPCFIGMVTVKFQCYAHQFNQDIENLLR